MEVTLDSVTVSDAAEQYLSTSKEKDIPSAQRELARFVQQCGKYTDGRDREVSSLQPIQVEEYSATSGNFGDEGAVRLAITKRFLTFLNKDGLTNAKLASFAKARRNGRKRAGGKPRSGLLSAPKQFTAEGHSKLLAELEQLKAKRGNLAEAIREASSTGDVSENSPLDAVKEEQGQVESRIRDLEINLKDAIIMSDSVKSGKKAVSARLGSRVVLLQLDTAKKAEYLLVEPSEADPSAGKLSVASPVGQAVLNHVPGDKVNVTTPSGSVPYEVTKVK
ncbi:MAG: Transcription elongation factor, GreA/GreB family [Chloroflexi bacterium]|nr:MAG: Transcription elongation factor, GreA/GreB family [Chloroflexota bacterium]